MKYVVVLYDGMADYPVPALGGKTPMAVAKKPNLDFLAKHGEVGLVRTVAEGLKPGSDVANMSVLGFDPKKCYTGRSPLEAASMGVELLDTDVTLRTNLVTLSDEPNYEDKTMVDYCAGDISTEEAHEIIKSVQEKFGNDRFRFYPGVSYRHCLVWSNGTTELGNMTPPSRYFGQSYRRISLLFRKRKRAYCHDEGELRLFNAAPRQQKENKRGQAPRKFNLALGRRQKAGSAVVLRDLRQKKVL